MTEYVEKPRWVCELGALETVLAIPRAVPILHAGPGCAGKLGGGIGTLNGCQDAGYISACDLPCSNIGEQEVVFGGAGRLESTIENAMKIYDGDLFVVLTGCIPAIVGDDVEAVAAKFQNRERPVVFADTVGFKGTNLEGHQVVLDAVFEQFLKPAREIRPKQVNVWASVPVYDPFWYGEYRELARLLRGIGLEPNIVFGPSGGLEALRCVPQAAFNLLVSSWVSLRNMQTLQRLFGTPLLHWPNIPVGPTETSRFLAAVAEFARIDECAAQRAITENEREYYYCIERAADELLKTRLLPARFTALAGSSLTAGLVRFLVNDMGLLPGTQFVTDCPPEAQRAEIAREIRRVDGAAPFDVRFVSGSGEAQRAMREKGENVQLLLGSGWEATFAKTVEAHCLPLAAPLLDRMVLDRSYIGYRGALTLLEDICTMTLSAYQR